VEPDTDPNYAIKQIDSFLKKIDYLHWMDYENPSGEREKQKLEIDVRSFLRTNFKDDDKKLKDLGNDRNSYNTKHFFEKDDSVKKQREYENDLDLMRIHLESWKTELKSILFSRQQTAENIPSKHLVKKMSTNSPILRKRITKKKSQDNRKIFIVHGHDSHLKTEVDLYLRTLMLEPVILHQQASRNKTIIEKVEYYSDVCFAVILLTADDIGTEASIGCADDYSCYARAIDSEYLKEISLQFSEFLSKDKILVKENIQTFVEIRDLYEVLKMRSRQNVLFECGYFIGKLGRENVAILCDPTIEIPTDLQGLCYLKIENGSWKKDLAKEIDAAGIKIDHANLNIFERMTDYLMKHGIKALNISSKTESNQVQVLISDNFQRLDYNFLRNMKNVGFINKNNELTDVGNTFINYIAIKYMINDSRVR
jgi:predicted nucleotide-binding protein